MNFLVGFQITDINLSKPRNKQKQKVCVYEYEGQYYIIHFFFKPLLGTCHMPDIVLGASNTNNEEK